MEQKKLPRLYPNIDRWMEQHGETIMSFSRRSGIEHNTLQNLLVGRFSPTKRTIDKLLRCTGLKYEVAFEERIT